MGRRLIYNKEAITMLVKSRRARSKMVALKAVCNVQDKKPM